MFQNFLNKVLSFLKNSLKFYFSKKRDFYIAELNLKNYKNKILYEFLSKIFNSLLIFYILISFYFDNSFIIISCLETILFSIIFGKSVSGISILLKFRKSYNLNFDCSKFVFSFLIFLDLFFNIVIFLLTLSRTGLLEFLLPKAHCMDINQESISNPFVTDSKNKNLFVYSTAVAGDVPLNPKGQFEFAKSTADTAVNSGIVGGGTLGTLKLAKLAQTTSYGEHASKAVKLGGSYFVGDVLRKRGVPQDVLDALKKD